MCFKGPSKLLKRLFLAYFDGASRIFHRCFKGASMVFQECLVFQRCFELFSNSFQSYLKRVFKRFLGEGPIKKKLRNFGHMSKMGLPYLPRTLVWTKKIFLNKSSPVYPTYLSKKFGHFGNKVCS